MIGAARWTRTDQSDNSNEILSLVRPTNGRTFTCAELEREYPYLVEICEGPNIGEDFVGLFDLDGDQINSLEVAEWETVKLDEVPAEVVNQIERGWEYGSSIVTKFCAS